MHVLICGGAGYIGSHMAKRLAEGGCQLTVLDDLSTGHREAVRWGDLVVGSVNDGNLLEALFASRTFDAVMHFSARSLVGESLQVPIEYYQNNVGGTLELVRAMARHGIGKLVFSSTAAVYGNPGQDLVDETHPTCPVNPYGHSKLVVEQMLGRIADAHGISSVSLRYFNAAGASPGGDIGESHSPETHLIPNVLRSAMSQGPALQVFGDEYPTPDGTCIRDYVHVDDLACAHELALEWMDGKPGAHVFNLGNDKGFSVLEVIEAARRVTGVDVGYEVTDRRPGDPARLVASSARARSVLGWQPRFTSIDDIVETAWRWHRNAAF